MPKNREPIKPESSEEEDEGFESGDGSSSSSSSSEEETPIPETQKPPPDEDSETESGNESDESDSEPDLNHKNPTFVPSTKPIAATPISQKPTAKKPAPPKPSEPVTPAKRTAQEKEDVSKKQQSKKKKTNQEASAPPVPKNSHSVITSLAAADNTKKFFQRLWSDDDEVAILQGMIDYEAEKNADPRADCDAFLEFIKDNLQVVDVNKVQLQHKIRRLKKKYDNIRSKDKIHLVKKPHDQAVYDLSDKIWGHETAPAADKSNGNTNKKRALSKDGEGAIDGEKRLGSGWVCGLSMEDRILHLGDELFGGGNSSVVDGAREWKRLRKEEMEISLKKLDLKRAQIKLVLDNFD